MMHLKKIRNLILLFGLFSSGIKAQLSGTYAVPGSYASIAAAIADLNAQGVNGAVTINVAAGHTETAPVGGFTLNTITGASAVNQVTFVKSGAGANPVITANVGAAIPSSAIQDGVWIFSGTDYVTVDGIDITDPNTSNPATMEFGYGFFKASATNGCQNNTIKNCVITLKTVNNAVGAGPAVDGSRGIDVVNAAYSAHTTAITVTSAAGANSNNKFYSNTILGCNVGISLIGFADATPFTFADAGNDVGGNAIATGNNIFNFGGGGTASAAAGVRTLAQYSLNASFNNINNMSAGGAGHAQALRGIFINTALSAQASVNNNTITVVAAGTTDQVSAIENAAGGTAASNMISINNNLITNCTYSSATSGVFYGIFSSASSASLSISNNILFNNSTNATSGSYYSIYNSGAVTSSIAINDNNINGTNFNASSTSVTQRGIYNTGAGSSCTLSINRNNFQSYVYTGAGSGEVDGIYNTGTALSQNINNNTFTGLSVNTSGGMYLIYCNNTMPANGIRTVNGNSVVTGFSKTLSGGTVYGYYSNSLSVATTNEFNIANNFSNINMAGSTALNVWYSGDGTTTSPYGPAKNIANNIFNNVTAGTGAVVVLTAGYSNANAAGTVSNNVLSSVSCSCAITGVAVTQGAQNTFSNSISSFTSMGGSAVMGILMSSGSTQNIYKNRIHNLVSDLSGGTLFGINVTGGVTSNIYNNLVGDLRTPAASAANPLIGISLTGGTTHNISFNSIHLNATSSGANFGSSAISVNASPTTINLRNNIFSNTSTAMGTGSTTAMRKSSTSLTNYGSASNNNHFYAGTPGSSNLIYYDGTNSLQTLSAFKTQVTPRELSSVTQNLTFQSVLGINPNFLNVNTILPTVIESGGLPITGITDDIVGTTRNVSTPDIGAWEGNFTAVTCTSAVGGVLANSSATACAGQTLVATASGVSTGSTTTYLWKVGVTAGGPYAPVTGGTGSTTISYTSAPLGVGVYFVVLETTCGALGITGISNEGTLTVNAVPTSTAAVTNSAICAGQNLNFTGSGSTGTFSWTGPGGYNSSTQSPVISNASPTVSGTYSLTVTNLGCTSAPATLAIAVNPVPLTLTLSVASPTICAGASQTISALGGALNPTLNFGTQANQNTATTLAGGYPAPYSVYYGGQRMQILILASELAAAGFVANTPINNIQFPVVSKGANWGGSLMENQNFQVNIGNTALTSLTAFQGGLTNVVAPGSFTPFVGYNNTHTFTSPFTWNGTSNIILETTFSNNFAGVAADIVVHYNSPTTFQSCVVYRADSQTAPAMATNNTVSFVYSARPDFKLNGTTLGTFSWTPGTGLSSTSGKTVTATPAVTTSYTLTSALGACSTNTTITVNVTPSPTLFVASSATAVCLGNSATFTATGAQSYSWTAAGNSSVQVVTPSANTTYTVMGQNQNCPPVSQTVSIVSNTLPVVFASASSTAICSGATATLNAGGAASYSWTSGPATGSFAVSPTANTIYTVTGTSTVGCSGQTTVDVVVNASPSLTVTPSSATVCLFYPATFTATGANSYSWSTNSIVSNSITIIPTASNIYTVMGINSLSCTSFQTVGITVNPLPVVSISPASPTICAGESVVLNASGASTYSWTNGTIVAASLTVSPTSTSLFNVGGENANNCMDTAVVRVTVEICTGIGKQNSAGVQVQLYPNPSTGLVTADFGFEGTKQITVMNALGAVILTKNTVEMSENIDLSSCAKGVYFVRISGNQSSGNFRVVLE